MTGKNTRRDFFQRLATASAEVPPSGTGSSGSETYLLHVSRRAMASQFEVLFNAGQHPDASTAGLKALDVVDQLEELLSYFRTTSQLTRLNVLAGEGPVEVDPRLFEVLKLALEIGAQTDWAIDITSAPLWEIWGFARRAGRVPSEEQLAEARRRVGGAWVDLDAEHRTVRFKKAGMRLNLGCIGKGYALDRAAEVLVAEGVGDFLLHGGQSSVLARGTRAEGADSAASPTPAGWTVGVRDPLHPDRRLAEIRLRDRALGTSAGTFQSFRHLGKRYGHILDPRTGWPAEGVLSVTVLAPTAALADGLSTAFFVWGPAAAREYCSARPEIAVLSLTPGPNGTGVEIHSAGFHEGEIRLLPPAEQHAGVGETTSHRGVELQ